MKSEGFTTITRKNMPLKHSYMDLNLFDIDDFKYLKINYLTIT